jgi:hypothetical protein
MARMAINPGIPIPSAMPRVSLERPFNGAEDGVIKVIAGTNAEVAGVGVVILKYVDGTLLVPSNSFPTSVKRKVFESSRLNPWTWTVQTK